MRCLLAHCTGRGDVVCVVQLCQLVTAVAAALERLCLPWGDWRLDATKLDLPRGSTLPPEVVAAVETLDRSDKTASQVVRSGRKPSDLAGACRALPVRVPIAHG